MKQKGSTNNFSVALGLFDFINPIFYGITSITILMNLKNVINHNTYMVYLLGAIISMIFGLTIPTVKFLVGLGKMPFKMPVNLVFYFNTGIFISGLMLAQGLLNVNRTLLIIVVSVLVLLVGFIVYKTKKLNTGAVLIGTIGYLLIYNSLISLAIRNGMIISIVLYALAICLFIMLCLIGIKSDLNNSRVHWAIEISNVLCQGFVALSTVLLFKVF